MSQIAVTYYKPPYPSQDNWKQDLLSISKLGFKAIQVEMPWGWIESEPDHYQYQDYDQLFSDAANANLEVIAVLKPEYQPTWVTRNFAQARIGAANSEFFEEQKSPIGTFPGCNPDHPDVWDRMSRFIQSTVKRYEGHSNLKAWVAMNLETPYPQVFDSTVRNGFEKYLQDEYKSIADLNKKWNRRYQEFSDISSVLSSGASSAEEQAFLKYQTVRMQRHLKARLYMIRSVDSNHPIVVYGNRPFLDSLTKEGVVERILASGNDWDLAEASEVFGCACYPKWAKESDAQRDVRLRFEHSAARAKPFWVGEFQRPKDAVSCPEGCVLDANTQQRWLWQSISMGAKNISFSNWRDEVSGPGAGFFGLAGQDGNAGERLDAIQHSVGVIDNNQELFDKIEPAQPYVGVIFNQESYLFMHSRGQADHYWRGFYDYCLALSQLGIPYRILEKLEVDDFRDVDILFAPRLFIIPDKLEFSLNQFIDKGGAIVAEAQCGAYTEEGILIPGEDRWISRKAGIRENNARKTSVHLESVEISEEIRFLLSHQEVVYPINSTDDETLHTVEIDGKGEKVFISKNIESGKVFAFGSFLGGMDDGHAKQGLADFALGIIKTREIKIPEIVFPQRKSNGHVSLHSCKSGDQTVYFVFCDGNHKEVGLRLPPGTFSGDAKELMSGAPVEVHTRKKGAEGQDCRVPLSKYGVAILVSG